MYSNASVSNCYNSKAYPPIATSLLLKSENCRYVVKTFPVYNCPSDSSTTPRLHSWNSETKVVHLNRLPVCSISIPLFTNQISGHISMRVNFGFSSTSFTGSNWKCINICDEFTSFKYPNNILLHPLRHIAGQFQVNLYSKAGCKKNKITHINSNIIREANGLLDLTEFTRLPETLSYQILRSGY